MSQEKRFRICIVYPADPLGVIPGGIDTFIRGILSWVPSDIEIRVVGVTTDPESRPENQWTPCKLGGRTFEFYPVLSIENSEKQAFIPVTLRFLMALILRRVEIPAEVLEFHRIEPCLRFLRDKRPKTVVMHQNMSVLRNEGADIRWRYFPSLYFKLEDILIPRISSLFCVREDAAANYRERYPDMADRVHFTPTWVDTEVFQPANEEDRRSGRQSLKTEFGFDDGDFVLITVGRLDKQKDPLLLIEAFRKVHRANSRVRLLIVGDGVLRDQIEERVRQYQLASAVKLCGVKPASVVSRYLRSVDTFVLSSAYEGMPMCVLEALGSGLPVVTTNVGEVARVVKPGVNGEIVPVNDADALAEAIVRCQSNIDKYRDEPCLSAIQQYVPQKVLAPVYENYRRLAAEYGDR